MEASDVLKVTSDTASSADVSLSIFGDYLMAYVGVRPVDVIDLSKSDALNVTTSATIGG